MNFDKITMKGIPTEEQIRIDNEITEQEAYLNLKFKVIEKKFNKIPPTKLRKAADYLIQNYNNEINLNNLASLIKISKVTLKAIIGELNLWHGFPLTWIPLRGEDGKLNKEIIVSGLKSRVSFEVWRIKKGRYIATATEVKSKAEKNVGSKFMLQSRYKSKLKNGIKKA